MTCRVNIFAWININQASDDDLTSQRDVPGSPQPPPIWKRCNSLFCWSYNAKSDAEVQNFHPLFSEMFDQRDEEANLIQLDSNLVHALVMDTCILG
jgi:hypothetical protein